VKPGVKLLKRFVLGLNRHVCALIKKLILIKNKLTKIPPNTLYSDNAEIKIRICSHSNLFESMDLKRQCFYCICTFSSFFFRYLKKKRQTFYTSHKSGKLARLIEYSVCVRMRVSKFTVMSSAELQPS